MQFPGHHQGNIYMASGLKYRNTDKGHQASAGKRFIGGNFLSPKEFIPSIFYFLFLLAGKDLFYLTSVGDTTVKNCSNTPA